MYIERALTSTILSHLTPNKVVVLYGPRRTGKTTLMKHIESQIEGKVLRVNGDDVNSRWLSSRSFEILKNNIGNADVLLIDEAQRIDEIGLNLKIIVDSFPGIRVMATGSSSFELANQVGEPLVGRKWMYYLYPLAQMEIGKTENFMQTTERLPERLIFGGFPDVVTAVDMGDKRGILGSVVDNYLFRDLLALQDIRHADKLLDLLRLVAFQIGHEVSLKELASSLTLNLGTIERYLDLLEKVFVIRRVTGFSRNLRKEISKSSRFYFFDNGVRNALINNFNPLDQRNDVGQLWENYLFTERLKRNHYLLHHANTYFWRTYTQQEVDYVEDYDGKLHGYEFKWGIKKSKEPKLWRRTYPDASWEVVSKENWLGFVV